MKDKIVFVNSQIACRTIDGEARIISVGDSKLHHLDPVGTFLWELIEGGQGKFDDLLEELLLQYEVEREQASADLEEFLGELDRLGLISWKETAD